jgi:diacylglycerol kinase family enzyme
MKYFFVLNPGSRGGKSKTCFRRVFSLFNQLHLDYDYGFTENLNDAYVLSRKANETNYDVVVAVGGDGTINKVLNGFYDDDGKKISTAAMGILYTGTSPDFCKSYNIPIDVASGLETLQDHHIEKIQIGKIVLAKSFLPDYENTPVTNGSAFCTKYFSCCANVGMGATLARYANNGIRKKIGDYAGTLLSLLRSLIRYTPSAFHIIRDGKKCKTEKMLNLSVGKTFYIASGIKVHSELKEGDSRFYCLIIKDMNFFHLIPCLKLIYSGNKIHNNSFATLDYCSSIHILGNNKCPEVEFDGDPQGFLPCHIQMAEEGLDLIVRKT